MLINYAVAHEKHARETMALAEKIWPGDFNFHFVADIRESDKLDVSIFPRLTELTGTMSGILVHSREQSFTFVEEEPMSFLTYIERALAA